MDNTLIYITHKDDEITQNATCDVCVISVSCGSRSYSGWITDTMKKHLYNVIKFNIL